jgi:hypothetical protein
MFFEFFTHRKRLKLLRGALQSKVTSSAFRHLPTSEAVSQAPTSRGTLPCRGTNVCYGNSFDSLNALPTVRRASICERHDECLRGAHYHRRGEEARNFPNTSRALCGPLMDVVYGNGNDALVYHPKRPAYPSLTNNNFATPLWPALAPT